MKTALLLVDIQNEYFPGGNRELVGAEEAAAKAAKVLGAFRDIGMAVYHIRHESLQAGATSFLPGSAGAEIHHRVAPIDEETVITKNFPNSFRATKLLELLKDSGIDHLVICGMMTHMCVDATVRAAADAGFTCSVVGDACATKDLEYLGERIPAGHVQGAFLAALSGTYARILTAADVIAEMSVV